MDSFKSAIWQDFCERYQVVAEGVPLFRTDGDEVQVVEVGQTARRKVLARSEAMEAAVIREVNRVIDDYQAGTELFIFIGMVGNSPAISAFTHDLFAAGQAESKFLVGVVSGFNGGVWLLSGSNVPCARHTGGGGGR